MKLKLFLLFGILFKTSSASKTNVIRYRTSILRDFSACFCLKKAENNNLERNIQKCYDGCSQVFSTFPGAIYDIGDTVMRSFKTYINILKSWNNSNSTIMSTRAMPLLEAIGLLSKLGTSPSQSLYEHSKVNSKIFSVYRTIVRNLSKNIGGLTYLINKVLTDLEMSFNSVFDQFQHHKEKIDFKAIMISGRLLANTISFIIDTALNDIDCVTIANDTYEAIAVLVCILFDNFLNIEGVNISIVAVFLDSKAHGISDFLRTCLLSLIPFVQGVANSFKSMTMNTSKSVRDLLEIVPGLTCQLNEKLNVLLGAFEGAKINVVDVRKNLSRA